MSENVDPAIWDAGMAAIEASIECRRAGDGDGVSLFAGLAAQLFKDHRRQKEAK